MTNSRSTSSVNGVWRRRRCTACGAVFTTEETVDTSSSFRFKSNSGDLEPFSRDMLFLSIHRSLGHRPTALEDATALTRTAVARALRAHQSHPGIITHAELIAVVHETLQRFDGAASTHYAAYHPL